MAIIRVRAKVNGTWFALSQDESGKWGGTIIAPTETSFRLSGGYYPVTIEAANDAGTVKTWDAGDTAWGNTLRLVVRETIKPVCTILSPSDGAYTTNNQQPFTVRVTDEAGGSGVALGTVEVKIDGKAYSHDSPGVACQEITNGYQLVCTPQEALADGRHTVTVNARDNDGNAAAAVTAAVTVDTVPPSLTVETPTAGLITNNPDLMVTGFTNDATSSPVAVTVALNGEESLTFPVGADGAFSGAVLLAEGANTIVVTARDAAGKESSVTREVKLDTSIPEIRTLTMGPNPNNTGESVTITLEVS